MITVGTMHMIKSFKKTFGIYWLDHMADCNDLPVKVKGGFPYHYIIKLGIVM